MLGRCSGAAACWLLPVKAMRDARAQAGRPNVISHLHVLPAAQVADRRYSLASLLTPFAIVDLLSFLPGTLEAILLVLPLPWVSVSKHAQAKLPADSPCIVVHLQMHPSSGILHTRLHASVQGLLNMPYMGAGQPLAWLACAIVERMPEAAGAASVAAAKDWFDLRWVQLFK